MRRVVFLFILFVIVSSGTLNIRNGLRKNPTPLASVAEISNSKGIPVSPTTKPYVLETLPDQKILPNNNYHVFQTFNNCGPASLSMALSFYGINVSQTDLGKDLRPYQIDNGDNDDKSVTLEELAKKGEEFGFKAYHRPNGNPEIIKNFINYGIPVITRTITKPGEDIGHFRVLKGFDDSAGVFVQDDSLQGKNLRYSYQDFDDLWKVFGYEYLVLVPAEKTETAKVILGENFDKTQAWNNAAIYAHTRLEENPDDLDARFNLAIALYQTGNFLESVKEFEKIESRLAFRTLWYQIEPINAYYNLGNYNRVFEISDKILNNGNRAYSELYILRGKIYEQQGSIELARSEYQKAIYYNKNLEEAEVVLNNL
jgi:tetratricopeptide (TPR) repeat protein